MATSLLYLSPCLRLYSILITASSGSVYVCSCCSYCGCYRVAGAVIKITDGAASGISGAYIDGAYIDGACTDRAYTDGACGDEACRKAYCGAWGTGWNTAA